MALKWGTRRQVLYYTVGIVLLASLSMLVWQLFIKKAPTCFDQEQNGSEQGVDCGGSCALMCPNTAKAPTVLWSRAFLTAPHVYTAAAYIQNNNVAISGGAKQIRYSFQLLDSRNILVAEREGVVDIPPVQTLPIIELNIDAGTREVTRTFFNFSQGEVPKWYKVEPETVEKIRVAQTGAYQNGRLTATIANDSYDDLKKVQAIAVLFDYDGVARAASKATLAKVPRRSTADITFTWPETFTGIARAEVTVLPNF